MFCSQNTANKIPLLASQGKSLSLVSFNCTKYNFSSSSGDHRHTWLFYLSKLVQVTESLFWHLFSVMWYCSALLKLTYSWRLMGGNTKQCQRDNRIILVTLRMSQRPGSIQITWNMVVTESISDYSHHFTRIFCTLWSVPPQVDINKDINTPKVTPKLNLRCFTVLLQVFFNSLPIGTLFIVWNPVGKFFRNIFKPSIWIPQ